MNITHYMALGRTASLVQKYLRHAEQAAKEKDAGAEKIALDTAKGHARDVVKLIDQGPEAEAAPVGKPAAPEKEHWYSKTRKPK